MPHSKFTPAQAEELAAAFAREEIDDPSLMISILSGSEIVLLKSGPFALDLIHTPDGIESFEAAKNRRVLVDGRFPVASLDDIIASKRATNREKDISDVRRLEQFKSEYER
jgi:hypothetical protein